GASIGEQFSVGASFAWSFAGPHPGDASTVEVPLNHLMTMAVGAVYRPSPYLSIGVVARDFNQPTNGIIQRSYDAAIALRPVEGHRKLELDLFSSFYEGTKAGEVEVVPGVSAATDVPGIGRVIGDVRLFDLATNP